MCFSHQIDGDDEDFEDETLTERIMGLSEMFPDFVRSAASTAYTSSLKGANAAYRFTRSSLWIIGTSVVILALPVVFEVERVQTEEAQLMQQRQVRKFFLLSNAAALCQFFFISFSNSVILSALHGIIFPYFA